MKKIMIFDTEVYIRFLSKMAFSKNPDIKIEEYDNLKIAFEKLVQKQDYDLIIFGYPQKDLLNEDIKKNIIDKNFNYCIIDKEETKIDGYLIEKSVCHFSKKIDKNTIFEKLNSVLELKKTQNIPLSSHKIEKKQNKENIIKILIADDDDNIRELIKSILGEDYKYIEAKNGTDLVNKAKMSFPDLIITDVIMPGLSGYRAVGELRMDKKYSDIPTIFTSARTKDKELFETLKPKGESYFVPKPYDRLEFPQFVIKILEKEKIK